GLGIGRLVFTAANIAGTVLLVALTALSWARPRVTRAAWIVLGGLWLVLLLQIAVIRPLLGARTDAILAGGDPGSSPLHVLYVVADLLLLGLLVAYLWIVRPARAGGGVRGPEAEEPSRQPSSGGGPSAVGLEAVQPSSSPRRKKCRKL